MQSFNQHILTLFELYWLMYTVFSVLFNLFKSLVFTKKN